LLPLRSRAPLPQGPHRLRPGPALFVLRPPQFLISLVLAQAGGMFRSSAPAGRGSSAKGHTFFPLNEAAKWPPHGQASRETRDPCIAPYRIRGHRRPSR
jgi:hypothetical protein